MSQNLTTTILKNLIHDENFCRKTIPHIKPEYFEGEHKVVYQLILNFINRYNKLPTHQILNIEFGHLDSISGQERINAAQLIDSLSVNDAVEYDWLIDSTEKWCKDRAVYLAIMQSISIIDGKSEVMSEGMIPDILSKALSVTFDTNVGHDYFESAESRYDFYHRVEDKIRFDIEIFNKITNGGVSRKTLNIILAGTSVGKSLAMCHLASAALAQGRNVLYITLEMAEEKIAERLDANLFDLNIHAIKDLSKNEFDSKVKRIAQKTHGRLIVKEYPTAAAHAGHFRALLMELKLKKNFVPDIIFIDYLNICASSRMKMSGSINTYVFIKAIAEELRGLAVEFNVPIWSATQVTRSGFSNSDIELTDTSESFGLPATADLMIALISTEQLEKMNQLMVKQLKNRYNDVSSNKRFTVGIDRAKMRLYDIDDPIANIVNDTAQTSVVAATPFSAGKQKRNINTEGFKV
jgi:archaellum biogenesis ATPase FlaH